MKTVRYKTSREIKISDIFPQIDKTKCGYCEKLLAGKQQKWCSKDCSMKAFDKTMFARGASKFIRDAVFIRDNGICAFCRCDTQKFERVLMHSERAYFGLTQDKLSYPFNWADPIGNFWRDNFGASKWRTFWQADHIIEVCNGGTHTMENLQTLCLPCHKAKTKTIYTNNN